MSKETQDIKRYQTRIHKDVVYLKINDTVELLPEKNCILVNNSKVLNCKYFKIIHPNPTIQSVIDSVNSDLDSNVRPYMHINNQNDNSKIFLDYNSNLYFIKEDKKYYLLIDKKTNVIKKIFKKTGVPLKNKEFCSTNKNHLKFFDKKLVPQKENLYRILDIPALINMGINTAEKISNFYNESRRHGNFYLNSCEILGWYDGFKLTDMGIEVFEADYEEKILHAKKAILESEIFIILKDKFNNELIDLKADLIANFLESELGFSKSTAKRRSSTLISWIKFLKNDHLEIIENKKFIKKPCIESNVFFEGCYLNGYGSPHKIFLNLMGKNIDRELDKIVSIDKEKFKYTVFIYEWDEGRLEVVMELDYYFLKNRLTYIKTPSYVGNPNLFINHIIGNKDDLIRLQNFFN